MTVLVLFFLFSLSFSASLFCLFFFFFNDTATTEIYTLSLHDALPISGPSCTLQSRPSSNRRQALRTPGESLLASGDQLPCSSSLWIAGRVTRQCELRARVLYPFEELIGVEHARYRVEVADHVAVFRHIVLVPHLDRLPEGQPD